jgi:hypothetical protein
MLADLIQAGKLMPVIEQTYDLIEAPEALRDLNEGHAKWKIVITANNKKEKQYEPN